MVVLRDMQEGDIENYVRWFTRNIEWCNWDSPWEKDESNEDTERASWTEYYNSVKDLPDDVVRWKFEIEADGVHIGWICSYKDLDYMENSDNILALGLDIPDIENRKNGYGSAAMRLFMDYLHKNGHNSFYTQTWSGNYPMIRLAEKLGFKEIFRKKDFRTVNGQKYDAVTFRLDI